MTVSYLDTSAALKLIAQESHSLAFARFYDGHADGNWVSSALLQIELVRAVRRGLPDAWGDAHDLLDAVDMMSIDDDVIDAAMSEPDRMLRSLDAIHVTTARILGGSPTGLAMCDDRLATAARAAGIDVVTPRDPPAGDPG